MQTNTLAAGHTNLFTTKEAYLAFIKRWKELAHAKQLTKEDCLLRCLLLSKDVEKALPVTKNELRLRNGAANNSGLALAKHALGCANAARALQQRKDREARRVARGGVAAQAGDVTLSWAETWVDPSAPQSVERGLSLTLFEQAQAAARALS